MGLKLFLSIVAVAVVTGYSGIPMDAKAGPGPEVSGLLRMAGQGDPGAMLDLGSAYYHGNGVLKDPFMAKCWIQKARETGLDQGDDRIVQRAERLWDRLALWQYFGECRLDTPVAAGPAPGDRFVERVTGMAFVWIPSGCFKTKSGQGQNGSRCPKGFWMGETEVTQGQWQRITGNNPSRFKGDDLPVEQVSFDAVLAFIRDLNRATGIKFSLPTEVQWEFACTDGGRRQPFPWGREDFRPQANCGGCDSGGIRGKTAPVGSFAPNDLGLYDMGGNVREWCRDADRWDLRDKPVRGGSFVDNVSRSKCRSGDRMISGLKSYYLGFRLTAESLN